MRGIHNIMLIIEKMLGITPAHAGNTQLRTYSIPPERDHPRACGEYVSMASTLLMYGGSPPRMRGIPVNQGSQLGHDGITPAHAGNT